MTAAQNNRPVWRAAVIWLACVTALTSSAAQNDQNPVAKFTGWGRDLAEATPEKYLPVDTRFYAGVTGSTNELLYVLCQYKVAADSDKVSLRGARDGKGNFWPAVSLAVSNDRDKSWVSIGEFNPSVDTDVLTIDQQNAKATLSVAADRFRPFVRDRRWGQIKLMSDAKAVAVFALEDLLPPRGRRLAGADFKEVLGDREKPLFGAAAVLRYITFVNGHLTGEFTWIDNDVLGVVTGGRSIAGDFYPTAILQIGDSEDKWMTIGDARPLAGSQSAQQTRHIVGEPFRVNLDAYKRHLEQAKFGKVIFSDLSYSVFALKNIDPSVSDD